MNKLLKSKKGFSVKELGAIGVAFVAVAIALSLGQDITGDIVDSSDCASGYTYNATNSKCLNGTGDWVSGAGETYQTNITRNGISGVDELTSWLPTIALVVACAVIIGIVAVYLAGRF